MSCLQYGLHALLLLTMFVEFTSALDCGHCRQLIMGRRTFDGLLCSGRLTRCLTLHVLCRSRTVFCFPVHCRSRRMDLAAGGFFGRSRFACFLVDYRGWGMLWPSGPRS